MARSCCAVGLVLLLVLCLAPGYVGGIIVRTTFDVDRQSDRGSFKILRSQLFGFQRGGSLSLHLDCDGKVASPSLIAVTYTDLSDWIGTGRPCSSLQATEQVFNLTNNLDPESTPTHPIYALEEPYGGEDRSKLYTFIIRDCGPYTAQERTQDATCEVYLVALNPGGEHLSRDQVMLPDVYLGLLICWGCILFFWGVNTCLYSQYSNGLHTVLTIAPLLKTATLAFELNKYTFISNHGWTPADAEVARILLLHTENAVFFITLLLISNGWCILQRSLDCTIWTACLMLPVLFLASNVCQVWVHSYFSGLSIILILCIAVCIIRASGLNVLLLRHRYFNIGVAYRREAQHRVGMTLEQFTAPLRHKIALLQCTRGVFIVYALVWTILELTSSFLRDYTWARTLALEVIEVTAYGILLLAFRLRDFSAYEMTDTEDEDNDIEVTLLEARGRPFAILVATTPALLLEFIKNRMRTRAGDRERSAARRAQAAHGHDDDDDGGDGGGEEGGEEDDGREADGDDDDGGDDERNDEERNDGEGERDGDNSDDDDEGDQHEAVEREAPEATQSRSI